MEMKNWMLALAMGLAVVACTPKAEEEATENEEATEVAPAEKTAADYVASKKEISDVSYLVGINFGSFIKGYNFGDLDMAQVVKGIKDYVNAKGNPRDEKFVEQFRVDPNTMNDLFNNYLENRHYYTLYKNKEAEEKFLEKNATKAGVQVTPSGLQYKIISAGNDVRATAIDTVFVNYKGTLLDGTVFDETPEGSDPISFTLNRVVKGWTEGLQLVGESGEIELYVPAKLGYGENGTQGIEPNSTLIFRISVDRIGKVAVEE